MTSRWARAGAVGALVAAAVVAVDLVGAPSGAQEASPTATQIPGVGTNADQAISDDGRIVVFEETVDSGVETTSRVLIHDRSDATTIAVPDAGAMNPSISGNGCFVTYTTFVPDLTVDTTTTTSTTTTSTTTTSSTTTSMPTTTTTTVTPTTTTTVVSESTTTDPKDATTSSTTDTVADLDPQSIVRQIAVTGVATLFAFDRCAEPLPTEAVVVARIVDASGPISPAAVSFDGTVIAYSNGDDIVRMQGTLTGYVSGIPFDSSLVATPEQVTGPNLDMSSDGSTIVFEAGTDLTPADATDTIDFGIHTWTNNPNAAVSPVASNSTSPTISADGGLVAFVSSAASDSSFLGVVVQTRPIDGLATNISIDPFGTQPDLSEDGRHVVYNTIKTDGTVGLALTSSLGDTEAPFVGVSVLDLSADATGAPATTFSVSRPAIAAGGDVIAFDADVSAEPAGTTRLVTVRSLTSTGLLDADLYDLGVGDVGDTLSITATYTNQGPASAAFSTDGVTVESPFVVGSNDCVGLIGPGATCTITITITIASLEDLFGSFTVTGVNGSTATAELTALGAVATTTTDATTTTTPPETTPSDTTVNTTRNTTRTTTQNTTRSTTRVTTAATTATTSPADTVAEIDLPPTFEPSTFDFAPTIINAGMRTASIEIVNSAGSAESVATAAFADPDAGFVVADTTCTAIEVGARCSINVSFSPLVEGPLATDLVVGFASGVEIRAAFTGVGAPEPTIIVIPGVATVGQVVTVQGAGFPAGSTVSLAFGQLLDPRDVVVNDTGAFNLPLVVIPNTPAGPMTVSVEGQPDSFGDVKTEMLVTKTTRRTGPGVLGTLGARVGS